MKRSIKLLSLLLISVSVMASGSGKGASEIYEMIESECSSTFSMSVNKDFEDLFNMDLDLNGKEKMVKGDFKRGRFLVVDKTEFGFDTILKEFEKRDYHKHKMEDDDSDETEEMEELYLMVDRKGEELTEVHFVLKGDEKIILFSLYGDIHLDKK